VPQKAWKRKKARELLGLLISLRGAFVSKEQLWDILFPESSPESAGRDLRVVLHSLFEVLDPERPHNSPARCIERKDDLYCLPWSAISLDLADFEAGLEQQVLQRSVDLVRGDYLEDFAYSDWAEVPRQRWREQYLQAADRLARQLLEAGNSEAALEVVHQMLQRDRCWEEAYRLRMEIHLAEGRTAQAAQVYDLCRETLKQELGVEPGGATEALLARCFL
jgi:LuxR family maltose regulon positive regulatory protein